MGGGGKGGGSSKNYFGDIGGVLCAGPVDELVSIIVDGATVWPTRKQWNNGAVEIPIATIKRRSNKARYDVVGLIGIKSGMKVMVTGCADTSFNTTTPELVTSHNSHAAVIANTGSNVATTAVTQGVITAILYYEAGDLVAHGGGIWECQTDHWAESGTEPPNVTYWAPYTVLRSSSANPYAVTIENFGMIYFYWGTDSQTLRADGILAQSGHPPYRRQVVVELENFLFGQERQNPPNVEVVMRRSPNQSVITGTAAALSDLSQSNPLAAAVELLTDPVFGAGQPTAKFAASFQTVADALEAASDLAYVSPYLDASDSARAFLARLLAYYDGWLRYSTSGTIEAGRFLHNEAPPTFTAATTIDYHDCVDEIEFSSDGWAETANEVIVKLNDRARAFKDAQRLAVSAFNRQVVGEPRRQTLDRPWITIEQQAADYAAEWGKIFAQPQIAGSLSVRAEKAASIRQGDLFLLTHDAAQLSVVCRCVEKTLAAPPVGRATLRFESERGIAPLPYQPTLTPVEGPTLSPAERISPYQFVQPPPSLVGDSDFRVTVLAARTIELTKGLNLWLQVDDAATFYDLGEQREFAVKGLLTADYADTLPAAGTEPPDDDTETLQIELDEMSVQADIDRIAATQTDDAINDNALLVWLFSAADPSVFEVCTVKSIVLDTGVYKLKVRRARYGTLQLDFVTGDSAYIVFRADIVGYKHAKFSAYAQAGTAATFRLQSFSRHDEADLADADVCPDIAYDFVDLWAPAITWGDVEKKETGDTDFSVATLSGAFDPTTLFRVSASVTDANSDLVEVRIVATLGTQEQPLQISIFDPASQRLATVGFQLPEGVWQLSCLAKDQSGRLVRLDLPDLLTIQATGSTVTLQPTASPSGGGSTVSVFNVTLTCGTPGATIYYSLVNFGSAPGSYSTYSAPVSVDVGGGGYVSRRRTLYAYASASGLSDSPVSRNDYWFESA